MIGDAMSGICYDDDAQVWKETWERAGVDKENPRIEITVKPLTPINP
jgi:Holliday junction resolvase RusA-like endonuclease